MEIDSNINRAEIDSNRERLIATLRERERFISTMIRAEEIDRNFDKNRFIATLLCTERD